MRQGKISKYNINALGIPIKHMHHKSQYDAYILHYYNGQKVRDLWLETDLHYLRT
jgi:hypothetical protein